MAFGNYGYNPWLSPYGQQAAQQPQQSGIQWVQGEAAAKAYPVAPNSNVLLMDSENSTMYLKSADASGMPSMRVFDYKERIAAPAQAADYVTREEFGKLVSMVEAMKGAENNE